MSLKAEGSMTFWLQHEQQDWTTNDSSYDFGTVRTEDISAEATKHPDKSVEVKLSGPFNQDFLFRHPIPECDERGLFVAFTWTEGQVKLYLNGNEVETQNETGLG